MAGLYDRVDLEPTPNPDVAAGPGRGCKVCKVLVATLEPGNTYGFVAFLTPTKRFGATWGPWHYCTDHVPAEAAAHMKLAVR